MQQAERHRHSRLFLRVGAFGIAVAIVGFGKTFFYPLFTGAFAAPLMIYVHGAFLFGWVIFFAAQSLWVHQRKFRLHKRMGWVGGGIVTGVVLSTLAVAVLASKRTAASGDIDAASGDLFVIMMEMSAFVALIISAFLLRRRPDVHKRLMLLAFIASLGPAWFRFRHYFPPIDNPALLYSVLLADSLIVIAALVDFIRERRVHWVYAFIGSAMVCVHLIEVFAFDAQWFRTVADAVARPFI